MGSHHAALFRPVLRQNFLIKKKVLFSQHQLCGCMSVSQGDPFSLVFIPTYYVRWGGSAMSHGVRLAPCMCSSKRRCCSCCGCGTTNMVGFEEDTLCTGPDRLSRRRSNIDDFVEIRYYYTAAVIRIMLSLAVSSLRRNLYQVVLGSLFAQAGGKRVVCFLIM